MSIVTGTFRGRATVEAGVTPVIRNVSAPLANTEYNITLNSNVKRFTIKSRGNSQIQFCFISGDSGLNFITVPIGCSFSEEGLDFSGTIYFQTNKPTQVIEVLEWY